MHYQYMMVARTFSNLTMRVQTAEVSLVTFVPKLATITGLLLRKETFNCSMNYATRLQWYRYSSH